MEHFISLRSQNIDLKSSNEGGYVPQSYMSLLDEKAFSVCIFNSVQLIGLHRSEISALNLISTLNLVDAWNLISG